MSILNENDSLIIIIDMQEKLLGASYTREIAEKKAGIVAKASNILSIPVLVTEQYPKGLGNTVDSVKESLGQNARFFEKASFSALDEEDIFDAVKTSNKHQIVVFGIETHICVSQTVNSLIELGYDVSVISDACSARDVNEHKAGIDRMREDGAHLLTAEIALFEWLKTSKHPNFKEVQNLIK